MKTEQSFPAKIEEQFNLAIQLRDDGKLNEACKKLTSLINEYPDFSPPYTIKGGILLDLKLFEEAEKCFRKAVQLKPKSELASLGLFHSLWEIGDKYDALEEMRRFFLEGGKSKDYDEILSEIDRKIKNT